MKLHVLMAAERTYEWLEGRPVRAYTNRAAADQDAAWLNDNKRLQYLWLIRRARYSRPERPSKSRIEADRLIMQRKQIDPKFDPNDYWTQYWVEDLEVTDGPVIPIDALVSELTR